jgi:regulatory protein
LDGRRTAYVDGLTLLSRRELSEAQLRQRLARRGFASDDIDEAIDRLKRERAIDDRRVAGVIARTETSVKRRGRLRVSQKLAQAGIDRSTARHVVDETFRDLDEDTLLGSALARRLPGGDAIADDDEMQRLYRYLVRQGFDSDKVLRLLRTRRRAG